MPGSALTNGTLRSKARTERKPLPAKPTYSGFPHGSRCKSSSTSEQSTYFDAGEPQWADGATTNKPVNYSKKSLKFPVGVNGTPLMKSDHNFATRAAAGAELAAREEAAEKAKRAANQGQAAGPKASAPDYLYSNEEIRNYISAHKPGKTEHRRPDLMLGGAGKSADNGRNDFADKRAGATKHPFKPQRRDRSGSVSSMASSISSVWSGIKSALKAGFGEPSFPVSRSGSNVSKSSKKPQKSKTKGNNSFADFVAEPRSTEPPRAGRADMSKEDWIKYDKDVAAMKAKISRPILQGPIFQADQFHEHELRAMADRQGKSHKKMRTDSGTVIAEKITPQGAYLQTNDFQRPYRVEQPAAKKHQRGKGSIDRVLGQLSLKTKDSDESFACAGIPQQRVCNGCGRKLRSKSGPAWASCSYCPPGTSSKAPLPAKPMSRGLPSQQQAKHESQTSISPLTTPDLVVKQKYPDHPAFRTHAANRDFRDPVVNVEVNDLVPPSTRQDTSITGTEQPLCRHDSARAYVQPELTKSVFMHDMGNPFDRQTILQQSPLGALTTENLARLQAAHGVPPVPTLPQIPSGFSSDAARDTKFYDFYDDVLQAPVKQIKVQDVKRRQPKMVTVGKGT